MLLLWKYGSCLAAHRLRREVRPEEGGTGHNILSKTVSPFHCNTKVWRWPKVNVLFPPLSLFFYVVTIKADLFQGCLTSCQVIWFALRLLEWCRDCWESESVSCFSYFWMVTFSFSKQLAEQALISAFFPQEWWFSKRTREMFGGGGRPGNKNFDSEKIIIINLLYFIGRQFSHWKSAKFHIL